MQYASGTIEDYGSKIARICLHYRKPAEELSEEEVEIYLQDLYNQRDKPSKSMFEHTVYGLRCYYKQMGISNTLKSIKLPCIRKAKKLPEVLSQQEICRILRGAGSLRNKTILSMLYSAGLRIGELQRLRVGDIDADRKKVHVRQGKGRKDRLVPLAQAQWKMLSAYIERFHPVGWLFYGSTPHTQVKDREVRSILHFVCESCGIEKSVCCHTLRHSYATHLLEMGENIYRISRFLGHRNIQTTLGYLHLLEENPQAEFSPLDRLFPPTQPA